MVASRNMSRLFLAFWCALGWAFAHPTIEGGVKHGLLLAKNQEGKGVMGGHIELVADPKANEVRIYLSNAIDEKMGDKNHEWVETLTLRNKVISTSTGKQGVVLLPLPDPGEGNEWFPVPPAEVQGGYEYYWIDVTARVVLDGQNAYALKFEAGQDARGTHCLRADLDLARAETIRLEKVTFSVNDPSGTKPSLTKDCYNEAAWGLGKLWKNVNTIDFPLKQFEEFVGKIPEMEKHRKPQVPAT